MPCGCWPSITTAARHCSATSRCRSTCCTCCRAARAVALDGEPGRLRRALPGPRSAGADRPPTADPAGQARPLAARSALARRGRHAARRAGFVQGTNLPADGLRQRAASERALRAARVRHRLCGRPHVHRSRQRQWRARLLCAAQPGPTGAFAPVLVDVPARRGARGTDWLFPAQRDPSRPLDTGVAQRFYYAARDAAGITKQGGIHLLRKCFATHLLESGVDLNSVSQLMEHAHLSTTSGYPHPGPSGPGCGRQCDGVAVQTAPARAGGALRLPIATPTSRLMHHG